MAMQLYNKHQLNATHAGQELASLLGEQYGDRHRTFVRRAVLRYAAFGAAGPSRGRPKHKISDDDAAQCAAIIKRGYYVRKQRRAYGSIAHAIRVSDFIKSVMAKSGCSSVTLYRAIKRVKPSLRYRPIVKKCSITPAQKASRLQAARNLLDRLDAEDNLLLRTVWVDAKSFETVPHESRGWIDGDDQGPAFTDVRVHRNRNQRKWLRYYAAVSPLVGPIGFAFTTGTAGGGDFGPFTLVRFKQNSVPRANPEKPKCCYFFLHLHEAAPQVHGGFEGA